MENTLTFDNTPKRHVPLSTNDDGNGPKRKVARNLVHEFDDSPVVKKPVAEATATIKKTAAQTANFLTLSSIDLESNYLSNVDLTLKEPVKSFHGKIYYLVHNVLLATDAVEDFSRVHSQFNKDGFSLCLNDAALAKVVHETYISFMHALELLDYSTTFADVNFYKFAPNFKVFDAHDKDVTSTHNWTLPWKCRFLLQIFGLFQYTKKGEARNTVQVKVMQMKILGDVDNNQDNSKKDRNIVCLL